MHYKLTHGKRPLYVTNQQKQVTKQYVRYDLNFVKHMCIFTEN